MINNINTISKNWNLLLLIFIIKSHFLYVQQLVYVKIIKKKITNLTLYDI